jgi:hypothetical protein
MKDVTLTIRNIWKEKAEGLLYIIEKEMHEKRCTEEWLRHTLEYCYCRNICNILGVDYCNITKLDIDKLKIYAYYNLVRNPNSI